MQPSLICPIEWNKPPLPSLILKEELLNSISTTFLPVERIQAYEIIANEKQAELEPCGWLVKCRHTFESKNYEDMGLRDYVYALLEVYKPRNTRHFEVVVLDADRFNVIYILECDCQSINS
ncbi:hypothetical protein Zmor_009778 [Zophobas morio]|uniref:Uncharacterized protein n=1 Tax=Zophobas morio TaxID=2755281 RepID=A0AA38MIY4_9CUCU|nr:hypothetical protein Zmor_009778 [Zophobas morio]